MRGKKREFSVGEVVGRWTVLSLDDGSHYRKLFCQNEKGEKKWVYRHQLLKYSSPPPDKYASIIPGTVFGFWTVLHRDGYRARCRCVCGKETTVFCRDLVSGRTKSCGCRRMENESAKQIKGRHLGKKIIGAIQSKGLAPSYFHNKPNKNNSTGVTGVCKSKNGYRAYICVARKQIPLGTFTRLEDAIAARKSAEQKYFVPLQQEVDRTKEKAKLDLEKGQKSLRDTNVMRPRICRQCGKEFQGGPRAWYCPTCRAERRREADKRARENRKAGKSIIIGQTVRKCAVCGEPFVMMAANQKYCKKCAIEAVKEIDRRQGREWSRRKLSDSTYRQQRNERRRGKEAFYTFNYRRKKKGLAPLTYDEYKKIKGVD